MASNYKPKKVTLLTTRKNKNDKPIIVFAKGVEVLYNGEKVNLGEYNTVYVNTKPQMLESINYLLEKEYINETQADEKREFIETKKITAEVVVELK